MHWREGAEKIIFLFPIYFHTLSPHPKCLLMILLSNKKSFFFNSSTLYCKILLKGSRKCYCTPISSRSGVSSPVVWFCADTAFPNQLWILCFSGDNIRKNVVVILLTGPGHWHKDAFERVPTFHLRKLQFHIWFVTSYCGSISPCVHNSAGYPHRFLLGHFPAEDHFYPLGAASSLRTAFTLLDTINPQTMST